MEPIVTTIRKSGGTFYARIPPEIVEQYALTEGSAIGLTLSAVKTEPLEEVQDDPRD